MDVWGDFSANSIFVGDSRVNLVWKAPSNTAMALRLYQANLSTGAVLDDFEYILESVINRTDYQWTVRTDLDTSVSNVFLLALYQQGETEVTGTSHYFNISSTTTSSTSTSGTASTTSTSSSTGISSATGSSTSLLPGASSAATDTPAPDSSSGGLSTGAKIGIGVSIPLAVIIGLIAGWLFFGRRRKQKDQPQGGVDGADRSSNPHMSQYEGQPLNGNGGQQPQWVYSGQPKAELGQEQRYHEMGVESRPGPENQRYELYAPAASDQR
ncbi:hypothetical protein Daus18300_004047 [Diaporthe australafricana]|uniref:Mid2 domain-containing protein n=1 Tax=Diaporthe australafricana TaxID=127596 RepID=A0ABR3XB95_9PEZI